MVRVVGCAGSSTCGASIGVGVSSKGVLGLSGGATNIWSRSHGQGWRGSSGVSKVLRSGCLCGALVLGYRGFLTRGSTMMMV